MTDGGGEDKKLGLPLSAKDLQVDQTIYAMTLDLRSERGGQISC